MTSCCSYGYVGPQATIPKGDTICAMWGHVLPAGSQSSSQSHQKAAPQWSLPAVTSSAVDPPVADDSCATSGAPQRLLPDYIICHKLRHLLIHLISQTTAVKCQVRLCSGASLVVASPDYIICHKLHHTVRRRYMHVVRRPKSYPLIAISI